MSSMRRISERWACGVVALRTARLRTVLRWKRSHVEHPAKLSPLEPEIAGESLIGSFAGDHDLVALLMNLARQRKERGTRGVEHGALGGLDQFRIICGDHPGACVEDGLTTADLMSCRCGSLGLVKDRLRRANGEARNRC